MVEKRSVIEKVYIGVIFVLLYVPLGVLAVWSFNNSISRSVRGGFTLHWYADLFRNAEIMSALATTAKLTVSAAQIGRAHV